MSVAPETRRTSTANSRPAETSPAETSPAETSPAATSPAEITAVHTRLMRCTLAVDDCATYWQKVDLAVAPSERAKVAFERRWFGTKSEARLRTIMTDMLERFDAFPEAFELLRRLGAVPVRLRPWICHLHTQLADPIYRRFTGELLPTRREQGYDAVDRAIVSRWLEELEPGRWGAASRTKFASNLLTTAAEAGLVGGRRDPRKLPVPAPPDVMLGYVLYLLRGVSFEGSLTDNPYLRSLGPTAETFRAFAPRIPGVRYAELGGVGDLGFDGANLLSWGLATIGGLS